MEYMTAREAAQKWNITVRRVQVLCSQGRIQGATRLGNVWAIPKDAKKPSDARSKMNRKT
ncbi:helix-turn-helix domain-containing protein [Microaerobacter geothermalis]|uniref:helix-turn-helix domain-containing protein n=1 Tax=Microaerobacter geothermalis TaxID=674972 RepID=UPI001F19927B|nr:helix-turn-helix domain-containing protein [Microaerobacter geothermalis]MCF6095290.1 helix-turn-helix domain-containing protein [Microaerobacter geothermalis]